MTPNRTIEAIGAAGELAPGDRVQTPNLGAGTLQPSPWVMPRHHLIQFDDGRLLWMLRDVVAAGALVSNSPVLRSKFF